MRTWIDQPQPMGLPKELQNLIIMTFALQTNRSFFLHGGPVLPTLENLSDDLELREQTLPAQSDWEKARERAAAIFGITTSTLLNASNVSKLIAEIRAEIISRRDACSLLTAKLKQLTPQLVEPGVTPSRVKTARAVQTLVNSLTQADENAFFAALIGADVSSSEQAMGASFKKGAEVVEAIGRAKWELLEAAWRLEDERQPAVRAMWSSLQQAFQADELAIALGPAVSDAESRAVRLLADISKAKPQPIAGTAGGGRQIAQGTVTAVTPWTARGPHACLNSDEEEVAAFYGPDQKALERNRKLVGQLKRLYGESQVKGDALPAGLPLDKVVEALEVHHIRPLSKNGADERSNMIVVSATLHLLIHSDPDCVIDLKQRTMVLFGVTLELRVDPAHNG